MLRGLGFAVLALGVAAVAGVVTARGEQPVAVQPAPTPTAVPTPSKPLDQAVRELAGSNKIYAAGKVSSVVCVLPEDPPETKAELLSYARVMVACMDKAWAPPVSRAQSVLSPVETVQAYDLKKPAASPECEDPPRDAAAYYQDGTICFEWTELADPDDPDDPEWNLVDFQQLIAHEYGHHVQESTGILASYDTGLEDEPKAVQLETERRLELQASCLGAAFLGANRVDFELAEARLEMWDELVRGIGDGDGETRDHGSFQNHAYWTTRAFKTADPASCNTFTASAKRVS